MCTALIAEQNYCSWLLIYVIQKERGHAMSSDRDTTRSWAQCAKHPACFLTVESSSFKHVIGSDIQLGCVSI